jgi:alanine racemase
MGRIGFETSEEAIQTIKCISELPNLEIEGLFTHFAVADSMDKAYTDGQFTTFKAFTEQLEIQGIHIPIYHCANSATIIDLPDYHLDMVRAGIMLYSAIPPEATLREQSLAQAMTLKTRITHIKTVAAGESIGYGRTFIASKKTRIATLPIGYADGYPRGLSGNAHVLVRGQRAPIAGRICMDQCMIDITEISDVKVGDDVVLFGKQGDNFIPLNELARKLNTINHEIICGINRRIPRIYKKDDKIVDSLNYLF